MSTSAGSMDIISGAVAGGTGISEIVAGILGTEKAKDEIKKLRKAYPEMSIPEAIVQATDLYRQEAQRTQLPGYDLYRQQLEQGTAQGIAQSREAATSAADLLGATSSLYGQQSQALTQLEIEGARRQAQMQQLYGNQLNTLGQWQQQQYYMNEYYPWVERMNQAQGNLQSSYDMLTGGVTTLAGSGYGMTADISGSGMNVNTQQQPQAQNVYLGVDQASWQQGQGIQGNYSGNYGAEINLDTSGSIWNTSSY